MSTAGSTAFNDVARYRIATTLADGTLVTIRSIRQDDVAGVVSAFSELDGEGAYTRFFSAKRKLSEADLTQLTHVDFDRVVALVATIPRNGTETLIGGGRYATTGKGTEREAELAFTTSPAFRRRGIAGLLLEHLIEIGRARDIALFRADVLAHNSAMLTVFRNSKLPTKFTQDCGMVRVEMALDES